ncbi:MAG: M14 family metallopeptidase [Rubricoccaceae bacterium]|nr:M14 family metallopeptidase [Rubricoccaceae bacterium]
MPDGRAQRSSLDTLLSRAERTGYDETGRYADVVAFLDALAEASEALHVTSFGETVEGRALPLVVWGAPDASCASVRAPRRLRVLVLATIHAGEVAGKEASLALLRDLARGEHAAWADSLVLLVAPIYNADGNERVAYDHRPLQLGPIGGMGQRPNAQGLDLNRDLMKLEAPESRALVGLLRAYDPHVVLDLHTTNGTTHGYHLTYAPPLHPNTPARLADELWARWLPSVTEAIERTEGWAFWHYGNVPPPEFEAPRAWYTFDARPRFSTNYMGLRNRFAILSEAYSYAPFEERVEATRRFVEEVVTYAWANAGRLKALTDLADAATVVGDSLALSATWASLPEPVEVLLGAVDTVYHPVTRAPMLRRRDVRTPERMPAYVRFAPVETERVPVAYFVPGTREEVIDLLDLHGIHYRPAAPPEEGEAFEIDSVEVASQPFQGRLARRLHGRHVPLAGPDGAPGVLVPMNQPLARLAFSLLEPRSDDGLAAWAVLPDEILQPGRRYPILRVPASRR